ncbi:MAG: hypothetical protein WCV86_05500 [Patescibacteria group bacterium]|jgi:hypothetical protein
MPTNKSPAVIKRLKAFAKEAIAVSDAFSRLGEDDNACDALALANIAMTMAAGLKSGFTPSMYHIYAGPSPHGMDSLLKVALTPAVAEVWLEMATSALSDIS